MTKVCRIDNGEFSLGDDCGPINIRVNGFTLSTDGKGRAELQNRKLTINILNDAVFVFGGDVTVHAHGTVQVKPHPPEQANGKSIVTSWVDHRALNIGDVVGLTFETPEGLERLNGWIVYNFQYNGVPQFLEPKISAPLGDVTWEAGYHHVKNTLKQQGHVDARLWTHNDGTAIFNNIVKAGHNDKAQLDITGSDPLGRYWEDKAIMVRYPEDGSKDWVKLGVTAQVRAVQDVPQLSTVQVRSFRQLTL